MKRGILLVLAIFLIMPLVTATMVINGPEQTQFNIGDKIAISGYVKANQITTGFLKFSAQCGENNILLQMMPVEIDTGEQLVFPSEISMPEFMASMAMQGYCYIRSELIVANSVIDWAESSSFEVSKDLDASFKIDEQRVQVGNDVAISGEITKLNGKKVDGSLEIYFRQNETKFLVNIINFKDSIFSYEHTMSAIPEGRYFVDILARDSFGNEKLFRDALNFVLIRHLYVNAKLDSEQYLPGATVKITGDARNALQEPVKEATVIISIDEKSYSTEMNSGKFEGSFQIPYNAKSGRHTVKITIKDGAGNIGLSKLALSVTAVPSNINIRANNEEFMPEDLLELTVNLYDQASDLMEGTLNLQIFDPNGKVAASKTISSGKGEIFLFPKFATPGQWTIKATKGELSEEMQLTVNEYKALAIDMQDSLLRVRNLGNVEFDDEISIKAVGDEETFTVGKKKAIGENETYILDLSSQLPTGMYIVDVDTPLGQNKFSDISILNGTSWHSFNFAYLLMVISCVGMLSYIAYTRMSPRQQFDQQKPSMKKNQLFKLRTVQHVDEKPKKFSIYNIGKDKDGEMADFKARILRDIKNIEETEKKRNHQKMFSRATQPQSKDKPKEGNGIFSMFD